MKATDQEEPLRYEDDVEEQGYKIGSLGNAYQLRKDKKIKLIDERQESIIEGHEQLKATCPWLKPWIPHERRKALHEREIEALWDKVAVYEKYAEEERSLRIKAVDAL